MAVLNERKKDQQNEILDPKWKTDKPKKRKELEPEVLVKQKLIQNIGCVPPLIKNHIEKELENVVYKRKTYFEVNDQFLKNIDKQVEQLNTSRRNMLGVIFCKYLL